jgi:DNA-binding transcriptional ArsR family regulator
MAPSTVFAALGDERRIRLVGLLADGDRTVSELADGLPITLTGTLKHIAVLERAGLVTRTKRGRTVTVHLERAPLDQADAWLHRTRTFWTGRLAGLARSFEETP